MECVRNIILFVRSSEKSEIIGSPIFGVFWARIKWGTEEKVYILKIIFLKGSQITKFNKKSFKFKQK